MLDCGQPFRPKTETLGPHPVATLAILRQRSLFLAILRQRSLFLLRRGSSLAVALPGGAGNSNHSHSQPRWPVRIPLGICHRFGLPILPTKGELQSPHLNISRFQEMGRKKQTRVMEDRKESDDEEMHHYDGANNSENGNKSLYEILGVERTATQQEIKKAYYKLALRLHPDKNPGDEEAKEKFQLLQKVISILGDEEKRALYDQTGCIDDAELAGEAVDNLKEFFKSMYKRVTEADIEEFEANYRGSDTEKKDLKDLYVKYKGKMARLFCSMLCSDPKLDSHRFKDILDQAIAQGELNATKAYEKWAKEISEIEPPTDPLVRRGKAKKKAETDLVALISQRRDARKAHFDSMFASLMAKAEGEAPPEPSEEEFQKARERLEKNKGKAKKGKH